MWHRWLVSIASIQMFLVKFTWTVGVDSQANSLAGHLHILCQEGGLKVLGQDIDGVWRRDCTSFSFKKDQDGHCSLLCTLLQVSDTQKPQSFGEYCAPIQH